MRNLFLDQPGEVILSDKKALSGNATLPTALLLLVGPSELGRLQPLAARFTTLLHFVCTLLFGGCLLLQLFVFKYAWRIGENSVNTANVRFRYLQVLARHSVLIANSHCRECHLYH